MMQQYRHLIFLGVVIGILFQATYTLNDHEPTATLMETSESFILLEVEDEPYPLHLTGAHSIPIILVSFLVISLTRFNHRQIFMYFLTSVFYQSNYFRKNIIPSY